YRVFRHRKPIVNVDNVAIVFIGEQSTHHYYCFGAFVVLNFSSRRPKSTARWRSARWSAATHSTLAGWPTESRRTSGRKGNLGACGYRSTCGKPERRESRRRNYASAEQHQDRRRSIPAVGTGTARGARSGVRE